MDNAAILEVACLTIGRNAVPALLAHIEHITPINIACMDESDVDALTGDRGPLVRSRYRALVNCARRFCELAATHGSMMSWFKQSWAVLGPKYGDVTFADIFGLGPATSRKFESWCAIAA